MNVAQGQQPSSSPYQRQPIAVGSSSTSASSTSSSSMASRVTVASPLVATTSSGVGQPRMMHANKTASVGSHNPPGIASRPPPTATAATMSPVAASRAAWFIGGNHVVKLLTSVDGDLDPNVLSRVATVPAVIGELALSIESLVSDDVATSGGFDVDVLAKIAANTLVAKRTSLVGSANGVPQLSATSSVTNSSYNRQPQQQQVHMMQQHLQPITPATTVILPNTQQVTTQMTAAPYATSAAPGASAPMAAPLPAMPVVMTTSAAQAYNTTAPTPAAVSPTMPPPASVPPNRQMDAATSAAYYKPVPNPLA